MKWYQEVTKSVLDSFNDFAWSMVFKHCGPDRIKLNKDRMYKLLLGAQCRSSLDALEALLKVVDAESKETVDKDFVLSYLHIMRMNIWNHYAKFSTDLKPIDLETAMQIDPYVQDLVKPEKRGKYAPFNINGVQ